MEAKNLRLHNWVLCNGLRTTVNIPLLKAVFEKNIQETVEPLPLTIEWLNKFGFDDSEYKKGYTGVEFRTNMILDFVLTKPKFMGEWQNDYCYDLGQHRFVPIKYVHELQNLFFAITTTELEIKEDVSACG